MKAKLINTITSSKVKSMSSIPSGYYCYRDGRKVNGKYKEFGICPYWSEDLLRDEYERGYCGYLQKGDWDINKEKIWSKTVGVNSILEVDYDGKQWVSAEELGIRGSLLWDKVKDGVCPKYPK